MSLIRCPDCNREISDLAPACPGCGRSVEKPIGPSGFPVESGPWPEGIAQPRPKTPGEGQRWYIQYAGPEDKNRRALIANDLAHQEVLGVVYDLQKKGFKVLQVKPIGQVGQVPIKPQAPTAPAKAAPPPEHGVYCPHCQEPTESFVQRYQYEDTQVSRSWSPQTNREWFTETPVIRTGTRKVCTACKQVYPYPNAKTEKEYSERVRGRIFLWCLGIGLAILMLLAFFPVETPPPSESVKQPERAVDPSPPPEQAEPEAEQPEKEVVCPYTPVASDKDVIDMTPEELEIYLHCPRAGAVTAEEGASGP